MGFHEAHNVRGNYTGGYHIAFVIDEKREGKFERVFCKFVRFYKRNDFKCGEVSEFSDFGQIGGPTKNLG